ncbi:unnamed protein product [Arabidopsis lyrata]|uniref:F-box protein At3g47030 n=1 Tax=Arabidopsis lyrata subsp. lyrata TaxID=81972 RepID=UPI000A29B183|nr:F-box protein At3g47030 [Arabidopsis lyrata subsp. lyrata]CAH8267730.1 unnamed protein product [Arabidopsis lyrata]|eukprot:XP_020880033.1 F-box protein At3g47030 [Arabidopsis lyrata subsp. lyrata]
MFGIVGFSAAMGKPQKQQVTTRPRNTPREISKEIPIDLLIDVFSRLSMREVARCRCVSKLWSSILRRRDFTQLFLKISSTRPRILFTFLHNGRRIFYSIPQVPDPDRNNYSFPTPYYWVSSSPISAYYQMQFPKDLGPSYSVCAPIPGLICCKSKKPMLCNPSTGESKYISLPRATTKMLTVNTSFVYDPIDKLFKVLCMSDDCVSRVSTLGTEEATWRTVECLIPHLPLRKEMFMDGVLYYLALRLDHETSTPYMVVAFDVRLERFKCLPVNRSYINIACSALIKYQGKLAVVWLDGNAIQQHQQLELCVLNDGDEVAWSGIIYELPYFWYNLAADTYVYIVGTTTAGEIVMATSHPREPFYIIYFSTVTHTMIRVEIEFGIVALKPHCSMISTILNHVEDVELMD